MNDSNDTHAQTEKRERIVRAGTFVYDIANDRWLQTPPEYAEHKLVWIFGHVFDKTTDQWVA
jgi:hypothetical protein